LTDQGEKLNAEYAPYFDTFDLKVMVLAP